MDTPEGWLYATASVVLVTAALVAAAESCTDLLAASATRPCTDPRARSGIAAAGAVGTVARDSAVRATWTRAGSMRSGTTT